MRIILSVALLVIGAISYAQFEKIEEYTMFGSRFDNAITVNGEKNGEKIVFNAENRSNYPYVVELEFTFLANLDPAVSSAKEVVFPGKSRVVSFTIRDEEQSFNYQYQTKYYIGKIGNETDYMFPYLIPLKAGTTLTPYKRSHNSKRYLINHFNTSAGDTICCMRKGYVVACPEMPYISDKISKTSSIEVMHSDGSVMVYENIDTSNSLVKLGQTVFPGQAIGQANHMNYIRVSLFEFPGDGKVKGIPFLYMHESGEADNFGNSFLDSRVVHPDVIVQKEMSKREVKRLKQGKLVL